MKKKVTSSKVPAAARSGFGRARPRTTDEAAPAKAEQVEEKPAQQIFRIAGVQMASGPSVSANLNEAKRLIGMAVDQGFQFIEHDCHTSRACGSDRPWCGRLRPAPWRTGCER